MGLGGRTGKPLGKPTGKLGGRKIAVIGGERYRQFAEQLHRHRAAIFLDTALRGDRKAKLVTALDKLVKELEAVLPREKPLDNAAEMG